MHGNYVDPDSGPQRDDGHGLQTLVLMLLSIALVFADHQSDRLIVVREGIANALAPVVWVAELPVRAGLVATRLQSRDSLERENKDLQDTLLLLQARMQRLEAIEAENERLRVLLASSEALEEKVLIAEIIDINQDPYRHQITLNKGRREGVYRGQALIDAYGILGQVLEVSYRHSRAILITDPDHGIPVEVNRTGLQTIAVGSGDGNGLRLPFLPTNVDIQEGDLLVSSPLGGRFPPGYPVGRIHSLRNTPGAHFLEALAHPSAQLNQGRQALLVWAESLDSVEATDEVVEDSSTPKGTALNPISLPTVTATPAPSPRPSGTPAAIPPRATP